MDEPQQVSEPEPSEDAQPEVSDTPADVSVDNGGQHDEADDKPEVVEQDAPVESEEKAETEAVVEETKEEP